MTFAPDQMKNEEKFPKSPFASSSLVDLHYIIAMIVALVAVAGP